MGVELGVTFGIRLGVTIVVEVGGSVVDDKICVQSIYNSIFQ